MFVPLQSFKPSVSVIFVRHLENERRKNKGSLFSLGVYFVLLLTFHSSPSSLHFIRYKISYEFYLSWCCFGLFVFIFVLHSILQHITQIRDNFDWMLDGRIYCKNPSLSSSTIAHSFVTLYNLFVNTRCICIVAKLLAHHLKKNVHLQILNNCWKHFSIDFCLFAFRFAFSDSNKMSEQ